MKKLIIHSILTVFIILLVTPVSVMQISAQDIVNYPVLKDGVDYYQTTFPKGLRYSENWYGTFSQAPEGAEIIMFDDDNGICVFSLPAGKSPKGEQGGTTLKAITQKEADAIIKSYPVKELVEPYDKEITDIMEPDHYFVGVQAGEKLKQKFNPPKNLEEKKRELAENTKEVIPEGEVYIPKPDRDLTAEEIEALPFAEKELELQKIKLNKPLTERQIEAKAAFEQALLYQGKVDLAKFDPDRYFVMGQVFFTDGTANCDLDGRQVADSAFTVDGAGNFTIHMASGTSGVVTGTNVQGTPITLAAGLNTITTTGAVADGNFDITIGTAANWNTTASWSATSGGACTASVPTNADNVYFDANSFTAGSQVLTVDATANCLAMDWTGATNSPTFTIGLSQICNFYGNVTLLTGMTINGTGQAYFRAMNGAGTVTLDSDGVTLSIPYVGQGTAGGTLQLIENLTITGTLYSLGNLDTNGKTVNAGSLSFSSINARTITFGSSIINLNLITGFDNTATNVTFTANTATINISGAGALTGGNADYNGASFNLNGTAHTVSGSFTCNVLTRNGTATKTDTVTFTSGATVTCTTFAMKGNSSTNRLLVQSSTLGTAATITATNWTGSQNVDLMDIMATNAVDLSAITGLSGDCGGNTGITFTPAAAQTSTGAGSWSGAIWTSRVPLPQDDVSCSHNVTVDMPRIGKSITFTGTPTVSLSNAISNYGSLTLASGMTFNNASKSTVFCGRDSYSLSTNGATLYLVQIKAPGGTYTLGSDLISSARIDVLNGTLNSSTYDVTTNGNLWIYGTATKGLNLGSGVWTFNSALTITKWKIDTSVGLTLNAGTSTIILTSSGANAQTFAGGGLTYNNVTVQGAGNYAMTVTGNNIFNTFTVDASQAAKTIVATGTTQIVTNFKRGTAMSTNVVTMTGGTWSKTGGVMVNNTGTATGSPIKLVAAVNTPTITVAGTFDITLPADVSGTAETGGWTVTDSPKALAAGATTTITVEPAGAGTITITLIPTNTADIALDYMSITNSTAVPATTWYAGDTPAHSTDGGGNAGWVFTEVPLTGLISTNACTGITMDKDGVTGATFNGVIGTIDGTPTITISFEYGLTEAYGSSTAGVVVYASGSYTANPPTNLTPGATYHYRFVGTNSNGTTNGNDQTFTFTMPTVSTSAASGIIPGSYTLNGNLSNLGVATDCYVYFEYGETPAYGYQTTDTTKAATGTYSDTNNVVNISQSVYFRAVAKCGTVVSNGSQLTFSSIAKVYQFTGLPLMLYTVPVIILIVILPTIIGITGMRTYRGGDQSKGIILIGIGVVFLIIAFFALNFIIEAIKTILTAV